jgi:two-component system CheB/CheR fusion protein
MAREGLKVPLSSLIRSAVNKKEEGPTSRKIILDEDGRSLAVNVTIEAMSEPAGELYLVLFEDVLEEQRKTKGDILKKGKEKEMKDVLEELRYTRENLRTTVEELEAANEELKSSNEEYQSTNEELQSANEELNSSKEELQSLNEELETVNRELYEKMQEVQNAYADLRNFLDILDIPLIYLGNDLRIKRFNKSASRIINVIETDIGRNVDQITSKLKGVDIAEEARDVLRTLHDKQLEVQLKEGKVQRMRILPYRTPDNRIDGILISFVDA